jgi:hypothetical protein
MRKMSYKVELEEYYEIDSHCNQKYCETQMKVLLMGRNKADEIWQRYFLEHCDGHSSLEFKEALPQILAGENTDWYIESVMVSMYSTMIHYNRRRLSREDPLKSGSIDIKTEDYDMPYLKMVLTQTIDNATSMTTIEMGHGNAPKATEFRDRGYREIKFTDPNSEEVKNCEDYNNPVTITEYSW